MTDGNLLPVPDPASIPALESLVTGARVVGWSEGLHNCAEYLSARNAVIVHGVRAGWFRLIAAETNVDRAQSVDRYLAGQGPDDPPDDVVTAMWSWFRTPLAHNAALLRWLRGHNAGVPSSRRVIFAGLDAFGGGDSGGAHRDLAVRDRAQFDNLRRFAADHPDERILVFEQTEHLDPSLEGSLGTHLAREELGAYRVAGALWTPGDPRARYPLGVYRPLAEAAVRARTSSTPIVDGINLFPQARSGPFDLLLMSDVLHDAPR
ncbi:erythromycin esterase family protein [Corynebacterium glyciniphilum]|uniref:erythromycin esterase family protein n=1 Tax=Corynebacterium glyciniphilum TaxID=1404244 RepID=UPI00164329D9|nr:erythromycin esterase family protein [Corynebacterium glyciniphilum]